MDLDIWKHVTHLSIKKEGYDSCNECKKRPREKMGVMLAWVPKVQCYVRMAASAAGPVCPAGTKSFSSTRPRVR